MTAKSSPPRIPKGSKEGGQFMPKWVLEIREELKELRHGASQTRLDLGRLLFDDVDQETGVVKRGLMGKVEGLEYAVYGVEKIGGDENTDGVGLRERVEKLEDVLRNLRDRLGTSIIWNIAVMIAIAWLTAKLYGVAPY